MSVSIYDRRNWTRYPVSERDFRAAYTSLRSNHSGANHNDVRFLPLLFVVLAIAVRLAPDRIAGDAKARRLTSVRYYWCCEYRYRCTNGTQLNRLCS
jgi:hypothetical protein